MLLSDPRERGPSLREGFRATGKIIGMGVAMDLVYQWLAIKHFYPVEAIVVALLLAFLPYLLMRGVFTRLIRRRAH